MKTNTILKTLSVVLLLTSVIPAFGMNYFKRMTNVARPALTLRPVLTLRNQIAARVARSFVPRAQVAIPKVPVRPAALQTRTPTTPSSNNWYSWFKKPFVAVASFLGFGCATTQPALAQSDNLKTDDNLKSLASEAEQSKFNTVITLEEKILHTRFIEQGGAFKDFVKKTKIDKKLSGRKLNSLEVVEAVHNAVLDYADLNPYMTGTIIRSRFIIIRMILEDFPEAIRELEKVGFLKDE